MHEKYLFAPFPSPWPPSSVPWLGLEGLWRSLPSKTEATARLCQEYCIPNHEGYRLQGQRQAKERLRAEDSSSHPLSFHLRKPSLKKKNHNFLWLVLQILGVIWKVTGKNSLPPGRSFFWEWSHNWCPGKFARFDSGPSRPASSHLWTQGEGSRAT